LKYIPTELAAEIPEKADMEFSCVFLKKLSENIFKGFRKTTNNRMELLAVITALEKLKSPDNEIHIYTDSKYVADAINQNWLSGWIKRGWKNVKNPDLWQKFVDFTIYTT
jgi:ribonuclease HI